MTRPMVRSSSSSQKEIFNEIGYESNESGEVSHQDIQIDSVKIVSVYTYRVFLILGHLEMKLLIILFNDVK